MRKTTIAILALTIGLVGCTNAEESEKSSQNATSNSSFDISSIKKVDAIANSLPENIKSKKVLTVGTAADYAPAEFLADDLKTPLGYDIDLAKAVGKVIGKDVDVTNAEFNQLLPSIGSKYDFGISSFTVTAERIKNNNMVSYIMVGSSFAVSKGNPKKVNPDNICGLTLGVLKGTSQQDETEKIKQDCSAKGKNLDVLVYNTQPEVTTNLIGGKIDLMYADTTVVQYATAKTGDKIEPIGKSRKSAPQGIVLAKKDTELSKAVHKAVQHLMDDGTWKSIATHWHIEKSILTKSELNPTVK